MVQWIMNTAEKTSRGVTPAQLILNNSISLSKQILMSQRVLQVQDKTRPAGQIVLSDRLDEWIARQNTLIKVAREKQSKTDHHAVAEYPINSYVLFTSPVGRSDKLIPRHRGPYQVLEKIWLMVKELPRTSITYDPLVYDPARTSPLAIAQQNEQEFVVESINGNRGNRQRRI
jgi:hypothetical protein